MFFFIFILTGFEMYYGGMFFVWRRTFFYYLICMENSMEEIV